MIKTNENRKGYKETPVGWIPKDWEVKKFIDCCDNDGKYGINASAVEYQKDLPTYLRITDIDENGVFNDLDKKSVDKTDFKKYILEEGDIVFARTGATVGKTYLYNKNDGILVYAGFLIKFHPNTDILLPYFIKVFSESKLYWKWVKMVCMRSGQPGINSYEYGIMKLPIPPIDEQKIISEIFYKYDKIIEFTCKQIELKQKQKKALMQQLLTRKKRLKGFLSSAMYYPLKSYLKEISDKNKNLKIKQVLSVTNSKGFVKQDDIFERNIASENLSNYKIINKGQFAYNPSRVNVGSLDMLTTFNNGILSPMYIVFEVNNNKLLPEYLFYLLKSHYFSGHISMYVQGSVRNSLSFDGLCAMKFFIPSVEEQIEIVEILKSTDNEIKLLKQKLELLKKQKRGLMQVLLTGKIRVKLKQ